MATDGTPGPLPQRLAVTLRVTQVVSWCYAALPLIAVVAVAFGLSPGFLPEGRLGAPVVSYVATGIAAVYVILRWILTPLFTSSMRNAVARRHDVEAALADPASPEYENLQLGLAGAFNSVQIIRGSILVAIGLFAALAYAMEHLTVMLVLGVIMVAGLLSSIPTQAEFKRWLDQQTRILREQRTAG